MSASASPPAGSLGRDTQSVTTELAPTGAVAVVLTFNEAINARDLAGLFGLMTDTHRFIDSAGTTIDGKRACVDAWRRFFGAFPTLRRLRRGRGELAINIDRTFGLDDVPDALAHVGEGRSLGKVVVEVDHAL